MKKIIALIKGIFSKNQAIKNNSSHVNVKQPMITKCVDCGEVFID